MLPCVVVGIGGGSGSGKTTLARQVISRLSDQTALLLQHDHYYKELPRDLTAESISRINFDHPNAIDTALMAEHVRDLRAGKPIDRPVYDFTKHQREVHSVRLEPRAVIVLDGILILESLELRGLMDLKIFVDADADVRFIRRLERDIRERGRSLSDVIHQYLNTVRPMHMQFVEPSKRHADLVISGVAEHDTSAEAIVQRIHSLVAVRGSTTVSRP